MKSFILLAVATFFIANNLSAQTGDLSGNYYVWKPSNSPTTKLLKEGKQIQITDANGSIAIKHKTGNYSNPWLDWAWGTDKDMMKIVNLVTARFAFGSANDFQKPGRYIIEVEDGVLAFFDGNVDYAESGECNNMKITELCFVLHINESKKTTLTEALVKAKISSMLKEICTIAKEKNPVKKDIRGLDKMPEGTVTDFSKGKNWTGKYFVFRNEGVATRNLYAANQTADIVDAGDHIDVNSKFMKIKKMKTIFNNNDQYMAIEKASGHKILKAVDNTDNQTNGVAYDWIIEIEDGVLVLVRELGYNYFNKSESCDADVNKIDYIFFKDENACKNAQLGKIKTKAKEVIEAMCKAYTKNLEGPKSSRALVLPPQNNKDTFVERMSWNAIKNFYKKQGWNEELIGCYISSENWSYATKKMIVNGKYKDVIVSRYKNGVVFFKTSTGIYYVRGISVAQDVVTGHTDGTNFQTKTLYCPGILDAGAAPGSGFDMQLTDQVTCDKYRRK